MNQNKSTLYVFSDPPGADVYINNNPIIQNQIIVKTPAIITDIPEGTYLITFKIIGHRDDTIIADAIGGYSSSIYGVLLPIPQYSY